MGAFQSIGSSVQQRLANRKELRMRDEDFFAAAAEQYRSKKGLTYAELVNETKRISSASISELHPDDISYKTYIEEMKKTFAQGGQNPDNVMEEILKNGTSKRVSEKVVEKMKFWRK